MSSAAKRAKLSAPAASNTKEFNANIEEFMKKLQKNREETAKSILDYKFNKKRLRIISQEQMVPDYCEGIVYWMSRDSRVQDNWAFLFAQKLALKSEVPLHVCFCLIAKYLDASVRQFHFLLKGLEKVAADCKKLNISFHLLEGSGADVLPQWVVDHKIGAVVCDFNPLRTPMGWLEGVKKQLKKEVPLIQPIDWDEAIDSREADKAVGPVEWARPGYDEALKVMKSFIEQRLKIFATKRNNPTEDALSNLSPCVNAFLEEAIIQLVKEGKTHGFLRMYWCKKILEWTPSPEDALQYAIYLNDHYSIDGRDPNGYGWAERAVFGKIRYMNYAGCKRKFDIKAYVARHGGKEHKYVPAK
ncbi:DNA photolyase [Operophtera brumata]|uniref:DNA photolyase n=1 Tax=Operophtera brumata TaxID=104452 RepID=A0A0L7LNQ9_OPEBR|nr:DNA photolyase [Operophtera brumata]